MDVKEETDRAGVLVVVVVVVDDDDDAVGGASERASEAAAEDVLVCVCVKSVPKPGLEPGSAG